MIKPNFKVLSTFSIFLPRKFHTLTKQTPSICNFIVSLTDFRFTFQRYYNQNTKFGRQPICVYFSSTHIGFELQAGEGTPLVHEHGRLFLWRKAVSISLAATMYTGLFARRVCAYIWASQLRVFFPPNCSIFVFCFFRFACPTSSQPQRSPTSPDLNAFLCRHVVFRTSTDIHFRHSMSVSLNTSEVANVSRFICISFRLF